MTYRCMYRAVRPPNNDFKQLRHLGQNATIEFDFYNYLESKTCKFLQICQFILIYTDWSCRDCWTHKFAIYWWEYSNPHQPIHTKTSNLDFSLLKMRDCLAYPKYTNMEWFVATLNPQTIERPRRHDQDHPVQWRHRPGVGAMDPELSLISRLNQRKHHETSASAFRKMWRLLMAFDASSRAMDFGPGVCTVRLHWYPYKFSCCTGELGQHQRTCSS